MNTDDKHIEQLTRDLMQGAVEKPSASLMGRIMVSVMQEHQRVRRVQVIHNPFVKWIFIGVIVYVIAAIAIIAFLSFEATAISELSIFLKDIFPVAITISGSISMFILFAFLDKLLPHHN